MLPIFVFPLCFISTEILCDVVDDAHHALSIVGTKESERGETSLKVATSLGDFIVYRRRRRKLPSSEGPKEIFSNKSIGNARAFLNENGKETGRERGKEIGGNKCSGKEEEHLDKTCLSNYCRRCRTLFRYDKTFVRHCKQRHGNRFPYDCPRCDREFASKSGLLSHVEKKHGRNVRGVIKMQRRESVRCDVCGDTFKWHAVFERHALTVHKGVPTVRCPECPERFLRRKQMLEHANKKHFKSADLKCEHCNNIFESSVVLRNHAKDCRRRQTLKRKGDIVRSAVTVDMSGVRIRCDECPGQFQSFQILKDHYKLVHPEIKLHPCDYCDKAFRFKKFLVRHVDMRHADKDGDLKIWRKYRRSCVYKCQYCDDEIVGATAYEKHGKMHPGREMFYCEECGKGFGHRSNLWLHGTDYHGAYGKKRQCVYCTRAYRSLQILRRHEACCKKKVDRRMELIEKGEPPRFCKFCKREYIMKKDTFKRHVSSHGQYDYCTICITGFHRKRKPNGLAEHMRLRHDITGNLDGEPIVVKEEID